MRVPVEGVKHFNDNERRERHGRRVVVLEDRAIDALEKVILHHAVRVVRLNSSQYATTTP